MRSAFEEVKKLFDEDRRPVIVNQPERRKVDHVPPGEVNANIFQPQPAQRGEISGEELGCERGVGSRPSPEPDNHRQTLEERSGVK